MTVSYKVCDICGQKMGDGFVIDARFREVKDGKNAKAQAHMDICDCCWSAIREAADAAAQAEGAKARKGA